MIKRNLFLELIAHLDKKEISLIIGPRQAGKTTLMLLLQDYLVKKGEKTVFLNFDIERDKEFLASQEKLLRKIELEIGKENGYIFLDEIQRKTDAGIFLKGLYDMNLPYKFIVSGSGSFELKEKIHESLLGRKRVFELGTVTFLEFVNFKTGYRYENKLPDFFEIEASQARYLLEEFLNFGGYPKVILEEKEDEKRQLINEIYQSYLEKDIAYLLGVQKTDNFTKLFKIIASQIGNLVNISELSSTLGISQATVKNYLWYLEKTYILKKVSPYFKNTRKEITKAPVYYFYDLGLRNFAAGEFGRINLESGGGFLFENFAFGALWEKIKNTADAINFWRTKDNAEVDFVLNRGEQIIPIEVKKQTLAKPEIKRSLRGFIAKYQPREAYVVNLSLKDAIQLEKTKIIFVPYYEIFFNNLPTPPAVQNKT